MITNNASNTQFKRYAPGLYVDSTNTFVIIRDKEATGTSRAYYTVREFLEFVDYGFTYGVTIIPDYKDTILFDCSSLAAAKTWIVRTNNARWAINMEGDLR